MLSFRPIGFVRSSYTDTAQIPKGPGAEHRAEGVLELLPELEPGLTDIEGFSHLYVLWVFDRAVGYDLLSLPPTDDRPHGVFATRAPRRPNPLGLTVVQLLRREGARLFVRGLDMLDGTPIVDIKPYLSSVSPDEIKRGWLAEAEARGHRQSQDRPVDVFFYGLFMDRELLQAKGYQPGVAELAFVEGLALRIGQRAALVAAPGGRVHGVVMSLALPELERLYADPSVRAYEPQAVLAHLASGRRIAALCYNLPQPPSSSERNPEYARTLRAVAQRVGLPSEYIATID